MHLAAWIHYENRILPREPAALTVEEAFYLFEHSPGPEWSILLALTEDLVRAVERGGIDVAGSLLPPPRSGERSRAIGRFSFAPDDLRGALTLPGAGRFAIHADVTLLRAIATYEREPAAPTPAPVEASTLVAAPVPSLSPEPIIA